MFCWPLHPLGCHGRPKKPVRGPETYRKLLGQGIFQTKLRDQLDLLKVQIWQYGNGTVISCNFKDRCWDVDILLKDSWFGPVLSLIFGVHFDDCFFSDISHHPDVHWYIWIWMDVMQVLVYIIAWTYSDSHGLDACVWCLVLFVCRQKNTQNLKLKSSTFFGASFCRSEKRCEVCWNTAPFLDQPPWWRVPVCLFRLYRAKPLRERHVFDPFHLCLPIGVLEGVDVDKCLGLWHLHDGSTKWWREK